MNFITTVLKTKRLPGLARRGREQAKNPAPPVLSEVSFNIMDKLIRWLRLRKVIGLIPEGSVVCDFGCDREMKFLKSIAENIKQGIGIDKKPAVSNHPKIVFHQSSLPDKIPLEKESVDVVTMLAVLEHLTEPEAILRECHRILKKNGVLLLTTPTPLSKPILEFLAFRLHVISEEEIRDHKRYFWPKEVKKILSEIGFSKVKSSFFELGMNGFVVAKK